MKTFAILNQKGGTGKTTVSINLGSELAQKNKRILLIDIDPQGNATSASGIDKANLATGLYPVLMNQQPIDSSMIYSLPFHYYVLATNNHLAGAEIELVNRESWQFILQRAIAKMEEKFDYILIDCPPSLSILSVNALVAADHVIIPMQCEYFALEGLSDLAQTIKRLRDGLNPNLTIAGIIRSLYDGRNLLARDVSRDLELHFSQTIFSTIIHRNVRVAEAPSHQQPITQYAPESAGARCYQSLGTEFLERFQ